MDEAQESNNDRYRAGNRRRFAEAARDPQPDLALLCLLIGVEAALEAGSYDLYDLDSADQAGADAFTQLFDAAGADGLDALDDEDEGAPAVSPYEHSVDDTQIELDRLAGLLPHSPSRTPLQWAHALSELLGDRLGYRGAAGDYLRLESSLLQSVVRRRRGLPILLSTVWIEVARRAGAPVYGVALPGHFVIGFGDPAGEHVIADPFGGGATLDDGDLELLVAGATGTRRPLSRTWLQPAGPLEIVRRILNNIRAWAAVRPEHSGVQLWALDLALLLPHHPARLRFERAQLLVERGEFLEGAAALEEYARTIASMEPAAAETARRAARAAHARLN